MKGMDLDRLRSFLQVAEAESLSEAARRLHLSQPALSRQMKMLEDALGAALFERTGRGMRLTDAGAPLRRRALPLVRELEGLGAALEAQAERVTGELAWVVPPSVPPSWVAGIAQRYRALHPDVALEVTVALSGEVREGLLRGRFDLGILYPTVRSASLEAERLFRERLHLVASPGTGVSEAKPVSFREALAHPLVLPPRPHALRMLVEGHAAAQGLALPIVMEANSLRLIVELVRAGVGRSILARRSVLEELASGAIVAAPVVRPRLERETLLAWPADHPLSRPAERMRCLVVEAAAEERARRAGADRRARVSDRRASPPTPTRRGAPSRSRRRSG